MSLDNYTDKELIAEVEKRIDLCTERIKELSADLNALTGVDL